MRTRLPPTPRGLAGPPTEASAEPASENAAVEAAEDSSGAQEHADDHAQDQAQDHTTDDLGEVFGRVLALSQTISHPAFQRATEGFAENGRVYLVYADEELKALRRGSQKMSEPEAVASAIQICQAISFVHRR